MNQTFRDYIKAQGRIPRKPFILMTVMLIVFLITAQMYFIHMTQQITGIVVEHPDQLIVPLWGALAVFIAKAMLLPAVIMRARDAGWPAWAFGGLYSLHLFFEGVYSLLGIQLLPAGAAFVVIGMTFLAVIALMVRPSSPIENVTEKGEFK